MIIHWPGELARRFNYLTSSYDIVPTILQRLFTCKNPVSDYSIGYNLLIEGNRTSFLLVGSYINMGIFEADRATALETSGRITITGMKAEPLEDAVLQNGCYYPGIGFDAQVLWEIKDCL